MNTTLFVGCSYTFGTGFDLTTSDEGLWVNKLHSSNPALAKTNLINDSEPGRSNANIFSRAVYNLTHNNIKYAFVQWSGIPRLEFSIGLETYSTRQVIMPNLVPVTQVLNDITYDKKYISRVQNRLLTMMHDHYEIVKLIEYVNSLIKLCKSTNTQLLFINGLCPWDNDFFRYTPEVLPEEYTNYTKELLNITNRDDQEIYALYQKIHNEYNALGGINEQYWANLYDSLRNTRVDTNNDGLHPGIKSNKNTVNTINSHFNKHLNQKSTK